MAQAVARDGIRLCVVDDDPTGTQTVHGLPVYTAWDQDALREALTDMPPTFYLSTNARSFAEDKAADLFESIGLGLREALGGNLERLRIVSRSDSTLRGHFPLDVDAIARGLGQSFDGVILVPAFFEGGRYSIGGVHWVEEPDRMVPANETEFARDPHFGFRSANLANWIEEKTGGQAPADSVMHIGLELLRKEGSSGVAEHLAAAEDGRYIAADAACYADLDTLAAGIHEAERRGKRFVYRTAASFVKARAGIADKPVLSAGELLEGKRGPGLVAVGSYVGKTTRQLERLLAIRGVRGIELSCGALLDTHGFAAETARAQSEAARAMANGLTPVVYTAREQLGGKGRAFLDAGRRIMEGLCAVVAGLEAAPTFVVAKGGITSSALAAEALGVRRAWVLGQAAPGVPAWRLGAESKWPGTAYVVFPGNVGNDETLAGLCAGLIEES